MLGEAEFTLDIRPTFVDELDKTAAYIEQKFKDVLAADRLITDVYDAIDKRLIAPTSFKPCYLPPFVDQPYYRINVRNFTIYYIMRGNVMEVRWFRYAKSVQPLVENPEYDSSDPMRV